MESARQAVHYVSESVQSAASGVSKHTNKEIAKDSHAPIGTRLTAAADALGDKMDQHGHKGKANVHKEIAKA